MTGYTFSQLIDFTRTSAATFVNSSGNIASTPQSRNLLTFTNEFANAAWTKLNSTTITANSTAAPDGTSTADTLVEAAATNIFGVRQAATLAAGTATFSVFIKPNGRNWVQLIVAAGGSGSAFFNVATGAVGTTSSATATVTSAGNGWYRCAITFTAASGSNTLDVRLASADNTTSYTGDGTSGIFIWGAQLEQASAATDYTRNFGGLFPPRFDYDPVTRAPRGLLIEEQRTNLLVRSEAFSTSPWVSSAGVALTSAATISPDGTANGWLWTRSSTASSFTTQTVTKAASAITYTASYYVKQSVGGFCAVRIQGAYPARADVVFSISTGTISSAAAATSAFTGASATIQSAGNGWYRITLSATSDTNTNIEPIISFNSNGVEVDGTDSASNSAGFIYGAQLEAGAFATSYIPTVASQVSRSADVAAIGAPNFASWYNQSEGTFFAEFRPYAEGGFNAATVTDGGFNNRIQVASANNFQFAVMNGGTYQALIDAGTISAGAINKVAGAYRVNDFAASLNNSAAVTDTSGTVPTLTVFNIGSLSGLAEFINGHIRSIRFYPVRLTNAQLQALTA